MVGLFCILSEELPLPRFSVGREVAEAERSGVEAKTRDGPANLSLSGFGDKRDARVRVLRTPLIS